MPSMFDINFAFFYIFVGNKMISIKIIILIPEILHKKRKVVLIQQCLMKTDQFDEQIMVETVIKVKRFL